VLSAAYTENEVYPILMLLPLFRLLNLAMPVFFTLTLYSFPLVYAPMFLPIYLIIKNKSLSCEQLGLTFHGIHYYVPLGVATGMLLGWGEYNVLRPQVLTQSVGMVGLLELSVVMIFFVGFVEEFVFRSALQTVASERLGQIPGVLITSLLFGFMQGLSPYCEDPFHLLRRAGLRHNVPENGKLTADCSGPRYDKRLSLFDRTCLQWASSADSGHFPDLGRDICLRI
jgi:hypothetical protein